METKSWFMSKTVWVNLLTTAAGVLGYLAGSDLIAQNPALVAAFVTVTGGVNVLLRLITGKPLA
jgi:hypothetical protein